MNDLDDPLASYRRPGASLPTKDAVISSSGIRLREYKAFVIDATRCSHLLIKRSLVKKPETSRALPYSYLTNIVTDGYGFYFSLTFSLPFPSGPTIVEFRGEGMTPLMEGILRSSVSHVQIFDAEKFIAPSEGDFDKQADEWRGATVVREITITEKNSPEESSTKH